MIAPHDEQPQSGGDPGFFDSVTIDFCEGRHELFGLVRLTRLPGAGRASALALLFTGRELTARHVTERERNIDSWERAALDGAWMVTDVPLARWRAGYSAGGAGLELEANASSAPVDLDEEATSGVARTAGIHRYEQICEIRGKATVRGRELSIRCPGRRHHSWGAHDWAELERWRSLYAAPDADGAVTVLSALPAGSAGHGDELRGAYLLTGQDSPVPFEEVRISTVYGSDQLPDKAGLELFMPGDEYPSRVSGESVCGASVELGVQSVSVSFFRWSVDGRPALGVYETVHQR
jgi:hypothetical protein